MISCNHQVLISLGSVSGCEELRMFVPNHLGVAAIDHHIWSAFSVLFFLLWYSRSMTTDQPDGLGRQLLWPCWPSPTTARGKTAAGPGRRQGRHCLFGLGNNICSILIATLSNEIQNVACPQFVRKQGFALLQLSTKELVILYSRINLSNLICFVKLTFWALSFFFTWH